jgi:hypothetical protein
MGGMAVEFVASVQVDGAERTALASIFIDRLPEWQVAELYNASTMRWYFLRLSTRTNPKRS